MASEGKLNKPCFGGKWLRPFPPTKPSSAYKMIAV